MRQLFLTVGAFALIAAAPITAHATLAPLSPALQKIITDYDAVQREFNPWSAAEDGDREAMGKLGDDSPQTVAREGAALAALKARLDALPPFDP